MNRLSIVITKIHRALGSERPLMVEITIYDQLGTPQFMHLIPATMLVGNLEVGQRLVLVPIDQVAIKPS
jgi:hypothetical protein